MHSQVGNTKTSQDRNRSNVEVQARAFIKLLQEWQERVSSLGLVIVSNSARFWAIQLVSNGL
jgi:hypothetical protein